MRIGLALTPMLFLAVMASPAAAQGRGSAFEGTWIWDRDRYEPPPNVTNPTVLVEETLTVIRDDGRRYTSHLAQVFSNGDHYDDTIDIPEDGIDHVVESPSDRMTMRVTVLPDGRRHLVASRSGSIHDGICYVSYDGDTMTCAGKNTEPDSSTGAYRCFYHLDPHVVPLAGLRYEDRFG